MFSYNIKAFKNSKFNLKFINYISKLLAFIKAKNKALTIYIAFIIYINIKLLKAIIKKAINKL
jgi:hypothetical protein